jgi:hypothetical protein
MNNAVEKILLKHAKRGHFSFGMFFAFIKGCKRNVVTIVNNTFLGVLNNNIFILIQVLVLKYLYSKGENYYD